MKWRREVEEEQAVPQAGPVAEEWDAGWQGRGLSTGAAALAQRLVKGTLWAVLLTGPVLGVGAWVHAPGPVAATKSAPHQRVEHAGDRAGAGAAGFAELYLDAYLRARQGDEEKLAGFFPHLAEMDVQLPAKPMAKGVERLAAVRVVRGKAPRSSSVTVAARLEGEGEVRYFQVPVASSGGGWVATALPSEVSAPAHGSGPKTDYGRPAPAREGDPATATLNGFFGAYLADGGGLDRYLSPGTRMHAVTAAAYSKVRVVQFAVHGTDDADEGSETRARPRDGRRERLLVDVEAKTTSGRQWQPMTYALELAARDGRWEVVRMQQAPKTTAGTGAVR